MTFPLTQFRAIFPAFASVTDEVV
ncbi:DUF4054 domain-containing protein, partial [Bordetella avium]